MSKIERLNRDYSMSVVLFVLALVIPIAYVVYQLWPVQVYEVVEPMDVLNENHQVRNGEELLIKLERCKLRDVPVTVTSGIYDGYAYSLRQSSKSHAPIGCAEAIAKFIIPEDIPVGKGYVLRGTAVSELPLFKKVTEHFTSEEFEIIE